MTYHKLISTTPRVIAPDLDPTLLVKQINVLIVDDEETIRKEIIDLLKVAAKLDRLPPISVRQAGNGREALNKIKQLSEEGWHVHLVISDILMNIMDGLVFCKTLRNSPQFERYKHVPFMFISGHVDDQGKKEEAYQTKANEVYEKPLDKRTFPYILKNALMLIARQQALTYAIEVLTTKNQIIQNQKAELQQSLHIISDQKDILDKDLDVARALQCSLLPQKEDADSIPGVKIGFINKQMLGVGGDFLNFKYLPAAQKLGLFISDVSGHGTSSALVSGMIKAVMNTWELYIGSAKPENFLQNLRKRLHKKIKDFFITAYMCVLDNTTGKLTIARAAHPYLMIIRAGDLPPQQKIEFIRSKGYFISDFSAIPSVYEEVVVQLHPGDKLVLYTDGFTEAKNPQGEMLGAYSSENTSTGDDHNKLRNWFLDPKNVDVNADPETMCRMVIPAVRAFTGTDIMEDDLTMLIVELETLQEPQKRRSSDA